MNEWCKDYSVLRYVWNKKQAIMENFCKRLEVEYVHTKIGQVFVF